MAVSVLALILSQLPPVHRWFRRSRLDLEVHPRIVLSHKVGNPNVQFHLIISNSGGRDVRITDMSLKMTREDSVSFDLPAKNYYLSSDLKTSLLMTPFRLRPEQDWSHHVDFLEYFNRADDRRYRDLESALRSDIQTKLSQNPEVRVEAALELSLIHI